MRHVGTFGCNTFASMMAVGRNCARIASTRPVHLEMDANGGTAGKTGLSQFWKQMSNYTDCT
jgi:hypothetical protein